MTKPAVTVLIDTYNHERFIEEAIVSVLDQDFPAAETEVLVVDDGSTDRTPEIVRKFEPRVRLIPKPNGGQASAFNAGIPEAKGGIVAFLDGDDWWPPNKLTRVMETFEAEPQLGIVGHGYILVNPDGSRMMHALRESCGFQANTVEGACLFRVRGGFLGTSRMIVRSTILKDLLPVPEALKVQADEYLFTLAAATCELRILPEALLFYRMHDANGFQMETYDPNRLRRKQEVLATLARVLTGQLLARQVSMEAVQAIVERIQAEADQLRLMLDGGKPWETLKTERTLYDVLHPDALLSQRVFKMITLLPSLVMPPKSYYGIRRAISRSDLYLRIRRRWLPIPEMQHIQKDWQINS